MSFLLTPASAVVVAGLAVTGWQLSKLPAEPSHGPVKVKSAWVTQADHNGPHKIVKIQEHPSG